MRRIKQSLRVQPGFEQLDLLVELACPVQLDMIRVQLIFPVALIHLDAAGSNYTLSLGHTKSKTGPLPRKHHAGQLACPVLQRKIDMPRGMILAVRYLAPDGYPPEKHIFYKYILNISVNL